MFRLLNIELTPMVSMCNTAKPEVGLFAVRDIKFAYDANSLCIIALSDEIYERLQNMEIKFEGLLYSKEKPNYQLYYAPSATYLILESTYNCNLACRYCYVRHVIPDRAENMEFETAKRAIDMLLLKSGQRQVHIGFFGGEPFMNWELVIEVIRYLKSLRTQTKFNFGITTNGTLIDSERAKFLRDNNFGMIVSLDGHEKTHNNNRPMKDGGNSFRATMGGLETLKKVGFPMQRITLRSTYTADGIDLVERIAFLNELADKGYAGNVSVEPIVLSESACAGADKDSELMFKYDDLDVDLRGEYVKASEWCIERINEGKGFLFHHYKIFMQRLLYAIHSPSECGAGKGYMSIDPNGTIYACHRGAGTEIGSLDTGIDEEKRAKWIDNRYYNRPQCQRCMIRNICGGGCRYDSIMFHKNIRVPSKYGCWFKRVFFEEALWILSQISREQARQLIQNPRLRRIRK